MKVYHKIKRVDAFDKVIKSLEKYATYFGLGQKTNIELPGELSGTLAGKTLYDELGETWYYGNSLSAVIGQAENNFTPLQMARYIAMLANGGEKIANYYHLGWCNGKTFLKRVNMFGLTINDLKEVIK